jgi:hypothetical protein
VHKFLGFPLKSGMHARSTIFVAMQAGPGRDSWRFLRPRALDKLYVIALRAISIILRERQFESFAACKICSAIKPVQCDNNYNPPEIRINNNIQLLIYIINN